MEANPGATERHLLYKITQCDLSLTTGKKTRPALTPAK